MKLTQQFVLGSALMVLLVLFAAFIAKQALNDIKHKYDVTESQGLSVLDVLQDIRVNGLRIVSSVNEATLLSTLGSAKNQALWVPGVAVEASLIDGGIAALSLESQHYITLARAMSLNIVDAEKMNAYSMRLIEQARYFSEMLGDKVDRAQILTSKEALEETEMLFLSEVNAQLLRQHQFIATNQMVLEASLNAAKEKLAWLAISGVLILLMALLYLRRMLVTPIQTLIEMTREVGAGNLSASVHVKGKNEFAELANALNSMVKQLDKTTVTHEYFEQVLHYMPGILVVVGRQGNIERINRGCEQLLGYAQDELIGQPFQKLMVLENVAYSDAERAQEFRSLTHAEGRFFHKDGHLLDVSFSARPIRNYYHDIVGGVYIAQDATEKKSVQEKIESIQRLKSLGVLAGGVAHDFNNILSVIIGNLSMVDNLLEQIDTPKLESKNAIKRHLKSIDEAGARGAELCLQMLAYAGGGRYSLKSVSLNDVFERMRGLLGSVCHHCEMVAFEADENMENIQADENQLQQVIMNLVSNAHNALEGQVDRTIQIRTGMADMQKKDFENFYGEEGVAAGRFAWLEVSDFGCGMDEETIERMFEPFFTTKFTGRGLGMSAILGIVRGHFGALRVDSVVNEGTTIRAYFPVLSQTQGHALQADVSGRDTGEQNGVHSDMSMSASAMEKNIVVGARILVIDDELGMLEMAQLGFEAMGCHVITAQSGQQGLNLYRDKQQEIDVVLLDMTMPLMSGNVVFRELLHLNADVRVILTSGHGRKVVLEQFQDMPLKAFLHKPYELNDLYTVLAKVLAE